MSAAPHIGVLGAGVVGLSTAYYLADKGYRVTVLERSNQPASAASFANGAQLSYSFTDPMASPFFVRKIPRMLLGKDPAVRIKLPPDRALIQWGWRFMRACTPGQFRTASLAALKLALQSSEHMDRLMQIVPFDMAYRRAGKLVMVRRAQTLSALAKSARVKRQLGCQVDVVTVQEAQRIEPGLTDFADTYAGALYAPNDDVADAHAFTNNLADWLVSKACVKVELGVNVLSINTHGNRVTGLQTSNGTFNADALVVCAGIGCAPLLSPLGIDTPIYPVRGYSVTLSAGIAAPSVSITDYERKIVFSQLGSDLRIAGFADFVGYDDQRNQRRLARLLEISQRTAPNAADYQLANPNAWTGLRPMTPHGLPLVGPTRYGNLFLNCGHGMFGWTLACATGHQVASHVNKSLPL